MGRTSLTSRHRRQSAACLCAFGVLSLATVGGGTVGLGIDRALDQAGESDRASRAKPRPAAAAAPTAPPVPAAPAVSSKPARGLRPSRPVRLEIPRLGVRTKLLTLGKNADGTLQVPTVAQVQQAGWYRHGAAPGVRGAAVIAGHIDSRTGPAVFHRLAELRPGDQVKVLRKDRRTVVFQIDAIVRVPKDRFPTQAVYGTLTYPGIRLITCGGSFDWGARQYTDNVIAYGHLIKVRGPKRESRKTRKGPSTRSAAAGVQGTR